MKEPRKKADLPDTCPGLVCKNGQLIFVDCLRNEHTLADEPLLSTFEASKELRCHPETMLRSVRMREIYPVLYVNSRVIQIYRCAITDFRIRRTVGFSEVRP